MSATIPMPAAPSQPCTCQLCTGAGRTSFRTSAPKRLVLAPVGADDWRHSEIGELDD